MTSKRVLFVIVLAFLLPFGIAVSLAAGLLSGISECLTSIHEGFLDLVDFLESGIKNPKSEAIND